MAGDCTYLTRHDIRAGDLSHQARHTDFGQCTFSARAPSGLRDGGPPGSNRIAILRAGLRRGEPGMFKRRRTMANVEAMTPWLGVGAARTSTRELAQRSLRWRSSCCVQRWRHVHAACATTMSGKSRSPEALTLADHPDRDVWRPRRIATLMRSERPGLTPEPRASPRPRHRLRQTRQHQRVARGQHRVITRLVTAPRRAAQRHHRHAHRVKRLVSQARPTHCAPRGSVHARQARGLQFVDGVVIARGSSRARGRSARRAGLARRGSRAAWARRPAPARWLASMSEPSRFGDHLGGTSRAELFQVRHRRSCDDPGTFGACA